MTKKRRFVCSPEDMSRFNRRMNEIATEKGISVEELYVLGIEHYYHKIRSYYVQLDDTTKEMWDEAKANPNAYNLHMFAHHVIWQLLSEYDPITKTVGSMKVCLVPDATVAKWREVTQDCLYG